MYKKWGSMRDKKILSKNMYTSALQEFRMTNFILAEQNIKIADTLYPTNKYKILYVQILQKQQKYDLAQNVLSDMKKCTTVIKYIIKNYIYQNMIDMACFWYDKLPTTNYMYKYEKSLLLIDTGHYYSASNELSNAYSLITEKLDSSTFFSNLFNYDYIETSYIEFENCDLSIIKKIVLAKIVCFYELGYMDFLISLVQKARIFMNDHDWLWNYILGKYSEYEGNIHDAVNYYELSYLLFSETVISWDAIAPIIPETFNPMLAYAQSTENHEIIIDLITKSNQCVNIVDNSPMKHYRNKSKRMYEIYVDDCMYKYNAFLLRKEHEDIFYEKYKTYANFDISTIPAIFRDNLICPIMRNIFMDPVIAKDGHTYERHAIVEWFKINNTSPLTRSEINNELTDNILIKKMINDLFAASAAPRPGHRPGPV